MSMHQVIVTASISWQIMIKSALITIAATDNLIPGMHAHLHLNEKQRYRIVCVTVRNSQTYQYVEVTFIIRSLDAQLWHRFSGWGVQVVRMGEVRRSTFALRFVCTSVHIQFLFSTYLDFYSKYNIISLYRICIPYTIMSKMISFHLHGVSVICYFGLRIRLINWKRDQSVATITQ